MTTLHSWRELAACRNAATAHYDPFFDESEKGERAAIAICRICPVQGECLAYAIDTGQLHGVWGGTPQQELRRLITRDRRGRAQARRASVQHRNAANATMIDSDNVLLLSLVHPTSGFTLKHGKRAAPGSRIVRDDLVVATIYYLNMPVTNDFIRYFENTIHPELMEADISVLGYFVTEDSPNTFRQLPVREGEPVFVWFAGFQDQGAYDGSFAKLEKSTPWKEEISRFLKRHIKGKPEVLRLAPTSRSRLTSLA